MKNLACLISAAGLVFAVACGQTDAGITTSVKTQLAADDTVKAYQIDVDTQNHIVTLSGDVETAAAKEQAMRIARNADGVRDVIDQLQVSPTAATSGRFDGNDVDVDVDVDKDLEGDIKRGAEAVKDGALRGADAVKEGAKKTGRAIKDAVTDDDPDSDRDGK